MVPSKRPGPLSGCRVADVGGKSADESLIDPINHLISRAEHKSLAFSHYATIAPHCLLYCSLSQDSPGATMNRVLPGPLHWASLFASVGISPIVIPRDGQ